jgi:hypothetical protein
MTFTLHIHQTKTSVIQYPVPIGALGLAAATVGSFFDIYFRSLTSAFQVERAISLHIGKLEAIEEKKKKLTAALV